MSITITTTSPDLSRMGPAGVKRWAGTLFTHEVAGGTFEARDAAARAIGRAAFEAGRSYNITHGEASATVEEFRGA